MILRAYPFKAKKGLSQVVAVTLVVMLSVFAVSILFMFIIPTVSDNLEEISQERVELSIETHGGYTVWDTDRDIAMIQVKRGNDDLELEAIKFGFFRGSSSLQLTNMEARPDTYGLPKPGQKHIYIFDLTTHGFFQRKPEKIVISPVIGGKDQPITDETGELSADNIALNEEITEKARELLEAYDDGMEICLPRIDNETKIILISTCGGLQCVGDNSSSPLMNMSANYKLTRDIECSGSETWYEGKGFKPIGNCGTGTCSDGDEEPFSGTFEGNGFTISNLYINRPDENVTGLFGYINGADVRNFTFENLNNTGKICIGGVGGYADQTNFTNIGVYGKLYYRESCFTLSFPLEIPVYCLGAIYGCGRDLLITSPSGNIAPTYGEDIDDLDPPL